MPDMSFPHGDFGGLRRDVTALLDRRRALVLLGGAAVTGLVAACSDGGSGSAATTTTTTTAGTAASGTDATSGNPSSSGEEIPDETQGPFPADGSNGPNLLTEEGVVRSDITRSFAGLSGTAEGVPTGFRYTIVDAGTGRPFPGAALYLWHCTAGGRYSLYEEADQNYLRGVQVAGEDGSVTFASVFPGCYPGRWPHTHFEVFESLDSAVAGTAAVKTSQLALPADTCEAVYTDARYGSSAGNLSRLSLETDGVFRDGAGDQLATVTGSDEEGYTVSLLVRV